MQFRGIDGSGDWRFGAGVQSYFFNEQALAADIATSLRMFLKDCFFAMDEGVDWWGLSGAKNPKALNEIILQCRRVIAGAEGVVRVVSVDPVFDSTTRRPTITYTVDTIYSQTVVGTTVI